MIESKDYILESIRECEREGLKHVLVIRVVAINQENLFQRYNFN